MKAAALALLQDLARSRGLLAKGNRDVRGLKRPASCAPMQKKMVRMDGLGHADPAMLVHEANVACKFLMKAEASFSKGMVFKAAEDYFRASALATNVLFTAKVEKISLPPAVAKDMDTVIEKSFDAIRRVAKGVAFKALKKKIFGRKAKGKMG